MTFGPGKVDQKYARQVVKNNKYRDVVNKLLDGSLTWSKYGVKNLRDDLREVLREASGKRCVYCRRPIVYGERGNVSEHIEHFLDKSKKKYKRFIVDEANLFISCHACNIQKKTRDMLNVKIQDGHSFPRDEGAYRWLHPCFDDFHENIAIKKGWLYSVKKSAPASASAQKLIEECNLNKIEEIERNKNEKVDSALLNIMKVCNENKNKDKGELISILFNEIEKNRERLWKDI